MNISNLEEALRIRKATNEQRSELICRYKKAIIVKPDYSEKIYNFICRYGLSILENKYVMKSDIESLHKKGSESPQFVGWGSDKYNKLSKNLERLKKDIKQLSNEIGTDENFPDFSWLESCIEASKPIDKKDFIKNNGGKRCLIDYYIEKFGVVGKGVDEYNEPTNLGCILNILLAIDNAHTHLNRMYDTKKKQKKNVDKTSL